MTRQREIRLSDVVIDTTKLTERGQVVIPKEIRDKMGLKDGSRLIIVATDDAIVFQKIELVRGRLKVREIIERAKAITGRLGLKL